MKLADVGDLRWHLGSIEEIKENQRRWIVLLESRVYIQTKCKIAAANSTLCRIQSLHKSVQTMPSVRDALSE